MHVHLDAVGGIAGDMFIACCLDAWPDLVSDLEPTLRAAGVPDDWRVEVTKDRSHGIAGTRVRVAAPDDPQVRPTGNHREIRERLLVSSLEPAVADRAVDIFHHLATAEAACHDVDIDDVHFHEIADWDSVADIVGAAWIIETSAATSWSVSPLPMGAGTVATAHGRLPIPAPATARLLEGLDVIDDGIGGERVTPTGAAILRHLKARTGRPPSGRLGRTGHGLGTRDLPDRPNMLRLLTVDTDAATDRSEDLWEVGAVTVIGFEVDDQTPEDLAVGLERIRDSDAVLDVVQAAVSSKKGRLATHVQVLCRPDDRDAAIRVCFEQTTTIGLRWHDEKRAELRRHPTKRRGISGKAARRPDGEITLKPEMDEIAAVADTQSGRAEQRERFGATGDEHP